MSNKTFLITLIAAVALASFIGVSTSSQYSKRPQKQNKSLSTKTKPQTILTLRPNPVIININNQNTQQSQVQVHMDTQKNRVTAVQLELSYDPKILTNVTISPGTFFSENVELLKTVENGKISYALGVSPNAHGKRGRGVVAVITFRTHSTQEQKTEIKFLPKTLVSAEGESNSMLRSTQSLHVYITK